MLNLKKLFDNTHGDQKSKCIKSSLFDSSRWQIYLYLNSGPEAYLSLYLSCEPTLQEREQGAESARSAVLGVKNESASSKNTGKKLGPWKREGKFKFSFEVRSLDGKSTFKQMEASVSVSRFVLFSKCFVWLSISFFLGASAFLRSILTRITRRTGSRLRRITKKLGISIFH